VSKACERLHQIVSKFPRFKADFNPTDIPFNGIYFLFERGESYKEYDRIVRIGTHRGQNNLAKRILKLLVTPNKDSSIFRKHIGRCILRRDNDPFVDLWEIDLIPKANREKYAHLINMETLSSVETDVSRYMTENISFSVISVFQQSDRMLYEGRLITTVAQCSECRPSTNWLGLHHPNSIIATTGLWNIQGRNEHALTEEEIETLCIVSSRGN